MMNKKGLSFGRLILYILFITILGFIIYFLVLTYKEIKKKNDDNSVNSSLRFVENNSIVINPVDSIDYFTINNITSNFGFGSSNPFYPNLTFSDVTPVLNVNNTYIGSLVYNDNSLLVSDSFNNYRNNYNYLSSSDTNLYDFMSFKSNINVRDFNFTFTGTGVNSTFSLFYVSDLYVNPNNIITDFNRIDNLHSGTHYRLLDILPSSDVNASKVLYFGFGIYRINNYQPGFFINNNSSLSPSSNPSFPIHIVPNMSEVILTFDLVTLSSDNEEIYNQGYEQGKQDAIASYDNALDQLITENNSLNSQVYDLNSRVNQQAQIISQLQEEINSSSNNFKGLFFTMADIPFKTVHSALGFEFWGVNLFQFFVGVLTALGIIWLIKKIL